MNKNLEDAEDARDALKALKEKGGKTLAQVRKELELKEKRQDLRKTPHRKKAIDYKVRVHSLPNGLKRPTKFEREMVGDTRALYQMLISSRLLWPVWMIDEFGETWVAIDFENQDGEIEYHTLKLVKGTYREVRSDA